MPNRKSVIPIGEMICLHDDIYRQRFLWKGQSANRYFVKTICSVCGKDVFQDKANRSRNKSGKAFCCRECQTEGHSGENNSNWRGGRRGKRGHMKGHILAYAPDHPFARKGYVPEHRLIVEAKIGRILRPEEKVHHKNYDEQDNSPNNLINLENNSQHNKVQATLLKCVKSLMDIGVLIFNDNNLRYEVRYEIN